MTDSGSTPFSRQRIGFEHGVQSAEEVEVTLVLAEAAFDAPDGHDDFPLHSQFLFDPIQHLAVAAELAPPLGDGPGSKKARIVIVPGTALPLAIHQFQNPPEDGHPAEEFLQFGLGKAVLLPKFLEQFPVARTVESDGLAVLD